MKAVALSHLLLREKVGPGDRVVDATCGNGNDTLFLARLVAPSGTVWAFDIQENALAATRALVADAGLAVCVELVGIGHERMADTVDGPVAAVIFNLGYLPGGDKSCITRRETTLAALGQAAGLLQAGGVVVVVAYPGHPGGDDEACAVDAWAEALPASRWDVLKISRFNASPSAPYVLCVEKKAP